MGRAWAHSISALTTPCAVLQPKATLAGGMEGTPPLRSCPGETGLGLSFTALYSPCAVGHGAWGLGETGPGLSFAARYLPRAVGHGAGWGNPLMVLLS